MSDTLGLKPADAFQKTQTNSFYAYAVVTALRDGTQCCLCAPTVEALREAVEQLGMTWIDPSKNQRVVLLSPKAIDQIFQEAA